MAYFLLQLRPPRPTFPFDATEAENAAMGEHGAYIRQLAADGVVIAAGPVFDPAGAWGLAVVEVADETAADELAASDPVVRSGLGFRYDRASIPSLILRQ